MSGGSYNYLYCKDGEDFLNYSVKEQLNFMKERLIELGFEDMAKATEEIETMSDKILEMLEKLNQKKDKLSGVWRAVEWLDSLDAGIDYVEEEIEKYRKELSQS